MRREVFGRFEPGVWIVTIVGFLNAAGFSISLPFLSLYLYQQRGLSMTVVGLLILVTGLCSAGAQLAGGLFSDKLGRRPVLWGSVAASMVLYLGIAGLIALTAPVWSIALLYVVERSALMMMRPAISAMIADLSPRSRLTETYGFLRVGQNVGWAAGPAIGGLLVAVLPYAWLFVMAAAFSAAALVIILLFLRESFTGATERTSVRDILSVGRDRAFLQFTLLGLLVFVVMGQMISTLSVFTVDRMGFSTEQYGLLLTANGALVVLFQYPMARLMGKLPVATALVMGSLLYGAGYLSMAWASTFVLGLGAMAVITSGEIVFSPTSLAVVGELSPAGWRGRYMGFYGLGETLGISVGPLLGGVLLDAFPTQPLFVWMAIALVALAAAVGFYRWGRGRKATQRSG